MRSWLVRLAAIAVLLGLLLPAHTEQAMACDCDLPDSPLVALEGSAAVFSGKLVSIESDYGYDATLTFEVFRVWKGPVAETLVLWTSSLGKGDCGYPFDAGVDYLVYADADGDGLAVWLCGATVALEYAREDLEALGEGHVPGEGAAAPETGTPGSTGPPTPPATGTGVLSARCDAPHPRHVLAAVALAALAVGATRWRVRQR